MGITAIEKINRVIGGGRIIMATREISFIWQGKDRNGKQHSGTINAQNITIARTKVQETGFMVSNIKKQSRPLLSIKSNVITPADVMILTRQLAVMLRSGVHLVKAIEITGRSHKNPNVHKMLLSIKREIESGASFTDALSKYTDYFDDFYRNMVDAGEQSGALEEFLSKIADYKEKQESIKKKIKKALIYPVIVLAVSLVVCAILLIFVVPVFESLFKDFGADLPIFTQIVLHLSEWVQKWWMLCIVTVFLMLRVSFMSYKRLSNFRSFVDSIVLKFPIIGVLIATSSISRFTRTLATMLSSAVPLSSALEYAADSCGNNTFKNAVFKVGADTRTGVQLHTALQNNKIFPDMVIQMVEVGEESGQMDSMLSRVADYYEEEADGLADAIGSLIEPLIMVILGLLVGGLVVAMYLPIFKIGASI